MSNRGVAKMMFLNTRCALQDRIGLTTSASISQIELKENGKNGII